MSEKTRVDVHCLQERRVIGFFEVPADGLLVEPVELIRSYRPLTPMYRFARRPANGAQFVCPRCNGMLAVEIDGQVHDALILGAFTLTARKPAEVAQPTETEVDIPELAEPDSSESRPKGRRGRKPKQS